MTSPFSGARVHRTLAFFRLTPGAPLAGLILADLRCSVRLKGRITKPNTKRHRESDAKHKTVAIGDAIINNTLDEARH